MRRICVEKSQPSYSAGGNVKRCTFFGKKSGSLSTINHGLTTIYPSTSTCRHITKRNESVCPHKNLYTSAYSIIVHKIQKAQMSIKWQRHGMDKQNMVHLYNGILFGYKKEWSTHSCYNTGEPWKLYAKWKSPLTKDHILYYSSHKKYPVQRNLQRQETD